MSLWTLVYNGNEKALADWGICADFACEFASKGRDTLFLRTIEGFDAGAAQFAWKGAVTLWRDWTAIGAGGTIFFQGWVGATKRVTQGGAENIHYEVYGPWWLFERQMFKQQRVVFGGWNTPNEPASGYTKVEKVLSEVYLGETPAETLQTNGQQVVEILTWVNTCYNPTRQGATSGWNTVLDVVQIGIIDPNVNIPITRANDIFCSEAIVNVLRWSPDCVCWFDYTTSPPTFHVRSAPNLAAVTRTITAEQERQISLAPQNSRQLPGVLIYYKITDVFNGVAFPQVWADKFPDGLHPDANGIVSPAITDWTPEISSHTIELSGAKVTKTTCQVTVAPIALAFSTAPSDRAAFWQSVDKTLDDPSIDPSTIVADPATVLDDAGAPVDTTACPNMLLSGQLSGYMGVNWISATLATTVSYRRYFDPAFKLASASVQKREVHHRVFLTNAITGTYTATTFLDPGETVPTGVAQAVYNSLLRLQHAGRIVFTEAGLPAGIGVGTLLTLTGPANTYSNLLVQSIRATPHLGELEVAYGPSSRLDAPELVELARVSRWRIIYNMPSGRSTGQAPGSDDVALGAAANKENTQHGLGNYSLQAVACDQGSSSGNPNGTTQITKDAQQERIMILRLDDAGNRVAADGGGSPVGCITLALGDTEGQDLEVGRVHYSDSQGAGNKRFLALHGPPQPDPANDPGNGPNDIWLGNGGGGCQMLKIAVTPDKTAVRDDYIVCNTWDGANLGSTPIYVAKQWKLRCGRTAETGADGTAYTLGYGPGPDGNNVVRTKSAATGIAEAETVTPEWLEGDILFAAPSATGVGGPNPTDFLSPIAGTFTAWAKAAAIGAWVLAGQTIATVTDTQNCVHNVTAPVTGRMMAQSVASGAVAARQVLGSIAPDVGLVDTSTRAWAAIPS